MLVTMSEYPDFSPASEDYNNSFILDATRSIKRLVSRLYMANGALHTSDSFNDIRMIPAYHCHSLFASFSIDKNLGLGRVCSWPLLRNIAKWRRHPPGVVRSLLPLL